MTTLVETTETPAQDEAPKQWAVIDLMGHNRKIGIVSEETKFGAVMGRIDVPQEDGTFETVFFNGSSIYQARFCTEETAKKLLGLLAPKPVALITQREDDEAEEIGDGCMADWDEPWGEDEE